MAGNLAAKLAAFVLRHVRVDERERTALFETVVDLLKKKLLSTEERQMFTAMMLDRLGALPLRAKIHIDKTGRVSVNGRSLNLDDAQRLKLAATSMQQNAARKLVRETVTFMAIMDGVHRNVSPEMGLFAKAALWFLQEEDELYARLMDEGFEDDEERTL